MSNFLTRRVSVMAGIVKVPNNCHHWKLRKNLLNCLHHPLLASSLIKSAPFSATA